MTEHNDRPAAGALGWLIFRGLFKLLKVILIGSIVNIHFGFNVFSAFGTVLPMPRMFLCVVKSAQSKYSMIPVAAVAGIGEKDIIALVVADPIAATLRLG